MSGVPIPTWCPKINRYTHLRKTLFEVIPVVEMILITFLNVLNVGNTLQLEFEVQRETF